MRAHLALLCVCCACAQTASVSRMTVQSPNIATADSVTLSERAGIVAAILSFRQLVFSTDTTVRLDACSIALALGPQYRSMLRPDVRRMISDSAEPCSTTPGSTAHSRILVLGTIQGADGEALAQVTYRGPGSYPHEEEYKLRKMPSRTAPYWIATEMRVYDVLIVD
jgi:hypothetical protein